MILSKILKGDLKKRRAPNKFMIKLTKRRNRNPSKTDIQSVAQIPPTASVDDMQLEEAC